MSHSNASCEEVLSETVATVLAREAKLSPYAHLGLDFESLFQARLSDACQRWDGMLHKQGFVMDEAEADISDHADEMMIKLQDMTRQLKEKNRTAVVECHRLMSDMTATLTEVLASDKLEEEVHEHLKKAMETFLSQLKEQHSELADLESKEKQATLQAQKMRTQAFDQATHWIYMGLCGSLLAACLGTWHDSQRVALVGVTLSLIILACSTGGLESNQPCVHCFVKVLAPWLPTACAGRWWQSWMEGKRQGRQANMLQKSKEKTIEARDMWQGIRDSAEELRAHVETLSGLSVERVARRKYEMCEIAKGIIATWCAVGEYIVWRDQQGHFPANFSAQGLLGRQRYQQIYSAMFQPLPAGRRGLRM